METDQPSNKDKRLTGLRTVIEDCRKSIEYIEDERYERLYEYDEKLLLDYERVLHDVNASPEERDIACHVVGIMTKILNKKKYFEHKLSSAEAEIRKGERKVLPDKWNRAFQFMR